ncbi:hypothetical protein KAR91_42300 [Candidatus Pacearchaeota archaeon]|nr:hypothetical protein [Candidatus Pacearchaeota archaeon]
MAKAKKKPSYICRVEKIDVYEGIEGKTPMLIVEYVGKSVARLFTKSKKHLDKILVKSETVNPNDDLEFTDWIYKEWSPQVDIEEHHYFSMGCSTAHFVPVPQYIIRVVIRRVEEVK